jgi:hypothetical protein
VPKHPVSCGQINRVKVDFAEMGMPKKRDQNHRCSLGRVNTPWHVPVATIALHSDFSNWNLAARLGKVSMQLILSALASVDFYGNRARH